MVVVLLLVLLLLVVVALTAAKIYSKLLAADLPVSYCKLTVRKKPTVSTLQ